ncbi:MAG: hypothetical protein KAT04_08175 [Methylococcales bacterium]|nr:hypothetical protein [Methylococcales bacterium]
MYIIWSGRGFLVLVIPVIVMALINDTNLMFGDISEGKRMVYTLLISGAIIYLLAQHYNKVAERKSIIRAQEGKISTMKKLFRDAYHDLLGDSADRPRLFFIPMAWWGIVSLLMGFFFLFFPDV